MLEINKFNKIIVANWKLNGSFEFIESYFNFLESVKIKKDICGIICLPYVYLDKCNQLSHSFYTGAQDCSNFKNGAFTGDISAFMLKDVNCQFSLVGHSERRKFFNQTNEDIKLKIENLINQDLNPILCIGETLEEKEKGATNDVLKKQIIECLPQNSSNNSVIIAYEPIWAIGTGQTPALEEISNIHSFIKNDITKCENFKILYGGSVKSSNVGKIMSLDNIDGVLVGGASLDPLEFGKILTA